MAAPASRRDPGLQTLVDAVHGRGDLPAVAIAVLDGGAEEVAWAGAGAATDPAQRVRLASLTKTVMALTAHRLAAGGALALEDPVGGDATVADLLAHTAGLPLEVPGVDWTTDPPPDPAALRRRIDAAGLVPQRAPFRYSNTGFWLLGGLLADATGAPVEAAVLATLAVLPGLGDPPTGIDFGAADLDGHLVGARGRLVRSVVPFAPARRASGGLAGDLPSVCRLGRALLAATASTPALATERAPIAAGWGWTAGLEHWTTAGRPLLGHHGSWGGTRTQLVLDPADGRVAVAAVTSEAGAPALRALLTAIGLPPPSPDAPADGARRDLPLGAFADGTAPAPATLAPDPEDPDGGLLLAVPGAAAPHRARRLARGVARLLDGPHAGDALTTTPAGDVLRVGVRSLDPVAPRPPAATPE